MSSVVPGADPALAYVSSEQWQSIAEKWHNILLRQFPIARALPSPVSVEELGFVVHALSEVTECPAHEAGARVAEAAHNGCLGTLGPVASARALMHLRDVVAAQIAQLGVQRSEAAERRQLVAHLRRVIEEAALHLASRAPAHGPAVGENVLHCSSRDLLDTVTDLVFVLSASGHFTYANAHFEALLGYVPTHLIGRHFLSLVAPTCPLPAHEGLCATLGERSDQEAHEVHLQRADGPPCVVEVRLIGVVEEGRVVARVGVARDIEPRKRAEERLRRHNEQVVALNDVLMLKGRAADLRDLLWQAAERCRSVLGAERVGACYSPAQGHAGCRPLEACELRDRLGSTLPSGPCAAAMERGEVVIARQEGVGGTAEVVAAVPLIADGQCCGLVCFAGSVATLEPLLEEAREWLAAAGRELGMVLDNARLYSELAQRATMDAATGLLNAGELRRRLTAEIRRARRHGHSLCVMMVDVDDLKGINDACGHLAGDAALRCVADALRRCTRREDSVGRHGGDEFAVILPETDLDAAERLANRIRGELAQATFADPSGQQHQGISISAGAAVCYPEDTEASLLDAADRVCYAEKREHHLQMRAAG